MISITDFHGGVAESCNVLSAKAKRFTVGPKNELRLIVRPEPIMETAKQVNTQKQIQTSKQLPTIKEQRESIYQSDSRSLQPASHNSLQTQRTIPDAKPAQPFAKPINPPKSSFYRQAIKANQVNPIARLQSNDLAKSCQTDRKEQIETINQNQNPSVKNFMSEIRSKKKLDSNSFSYYQRPFYSERDIEEEMEGFNEKPQTAQARNNINNGSMFLKPPESDGSTKDFSSYFSSPSNRSIVGEISVSENALERTQGSKIKAQAEVFKVIPTLSSIPIINQYPSTISRQTNPQQPTLLQPTTNNPNTIRQQQLALWHQQVDSSSCCLCLSFGVPMPQPAANTSLGIEYRNPSVSWWS